MLGDEEVHSSRFRAPPVECMPSAGNDCYRSAVILHNLYLKIDLLLNIASFVCGNKTEFMVSLFVPLFPHPLRTVIDYSSIICNL